MNGTQTMKALALVVVMATVVGLPACAAPLFVGSDRWFADEDVGRSALLKRARFELSCDDESIALAPLGADPRARWVSTGASGCGQKAVYVWSSALGAWVLDTRTD